MTPGPNSKRCGRRWIEFEEDQHEEHSASPCKKLELVSYLHHVGYCSVLDTEASENCLETYQHALTSRLPSDASKHPSNPFGPRIT